MIHKKIDFLKKVQKILYQCLSPLLSLENFWSFGGLDKMFYGINIKSKTKNLFCCRFSKLL